VERSNGMVIAFNKLSIDLKADTFGW